MKTRFTKAIRAMSIIIAIATIPLFGFHPSPTDGLDEVKYHHFVMALENSSTFNYFTVVKVKDHRSNKVKEICTKGNFLCGAVHLELRAGYDSNGERNALKWAMSKKDRYFEFKNPKALDNISFSDYDPKIVQLIQKKYNVDAIARQIRTTKHFSIRLDDKEMKALAHILFNLGFLTGESSCWGGTLVYVDPSSQEYFDMRKN
jgi:hypothetical protein